MVVVAVVVELVAVGDEAADKETSAPTFLYRSDSNSVINNFS